MKYTQDSREVKPQDIFIAMPGETSNGHIFINNALNNGAAKIVFHEEVYKSIIPLDKQLFVIDTPSWLLEETRKKLGVGRTVVTICGSVGKTTTTKLLYHLLNTLPNKYNDSVFTPRFGVNTLRGICFEILNTYNNQQLILLETAMDKFLELDEMAQFFRPHINAIVNIDISHFSKLTSMDRILRTEFGICTYKDLNYLVINTGNSYINDFLNSSFGDLQRAGLFARPNIIGCTPEASISRKLGIHIQPKHFTVNLDIALEILNLLDPEALAIVSKETLQTAVDSNIPADKRFELLICGHLHLLNDCYNAAPLSFDAFLNFISTSDYKQKLGIIGQINEIDPIKDTWHRKIYERVIQTFDKVIFIGKNFSDLGIGDTSSYVFVPDYQAAIEHLKKLDLVDFQLVGIKGSRGVALENVTQYILDTIV